MSEVVANRFMKDKNTFAKKCFVRTLAAGKLIEEFLQDPTKVWVEQGGDNCIKCRSRCSTFLSEKRF